MPAAPTGARRRRAASTRPPPPAVRAAARTSRGRRRRRSSRKRQRQRARDDRKGDVAQRVDERQQRPQPALPSPRADVDRGEHEHEDHRNRVDDLRFGDAAPDQRRGEEAHDQAAGQEGDVQPGELLRDRGAAEALDFGHPARHPQSLQRHEAADGERHHRRAAPERPAGHHLPHAGQLLGEAGTVRRLAPVGNHQADQRRHGDRDDRQRQHHAAPAGEFDRRFQRLRREHRAETAGGHDPADQRGLSLRREGLVKGLQRRHQAGRHAEPDQRPAPGEPGEIAGVGEDGRARGREQQQHGLDPARAEPVEQYAERKLRRPEREEVGAGQQPERVVGQRQFLRQHRPDHRVRGAEQIRQQVAGGERQEQAQPQRAGRGFGHGNTAGARPRM